MSLEPRNSPARRRLVAEGRVRVAVLVAGAYVLGAASGGVPALAGDPGSGAAVAACEDPARTTPTVVVDGVEIDCAALEAAAGSGAGVDGANSAATEARKPAAEPPAPAAGSSQSGSGAGGGEQERKPDPSGGGVVPADAPALTATPQRAGERDAAKAGGEQPAAKRQAAGQTGRPEAEAEGAAGAESTVKSPAQAKSRAQRRSGARARSRSEARRGRGGGAEDRAGGPQRAEKSSRGGDAATYAALPASWTSLTPLTLPVASVDGFPIPPFLLPIYQAAAAQYGVPWEVLAAINEIESDFGRNAGSPRPGRWAGCSSSTARGSAGAPTVTVTGAAIRVTR